MCGAFVPPLGLVVSHFNSLCIVADVLSLHTHTHIAHRTHIYPFQPTEHTSKHHLYCPWVEQRAAFRVLISLEVFHSKSSASPSRRNSHSTQTVEVEMPPENSQENIISRWDDFLLERNSCFGTTTRCNAELFQLLCLSRVQMQTEWMTETCTPFSCCSGRENNK